MKTKLLAIFAGMVLMGCGEPNLTKEQAFEIKKLQMQQDHERHMARIEKETARDQYVNTSSPQQVQYESGYAQSPEPAYYDSGNVIPQSYDSGSSDSGIGGTILAVGAGALAGYAINELLDDGYRSYTNQSGNTVYVDKNGRQIDKRDYDAYKEKHPTKHKLSQYNQKGKQAVSTGASKTVEAANTVKTKTVEAASVAKTKTVEAAKKVDQKVIQPTKKVVQKKTSSFKKPSPTKRK